VFQTTTLLDREASPASALSRPRTAVIYFCWERLGSLCTQAAGVNGACPRAYQSPKTDV